MDTVDVDTIWPLHDLDRLSYDTLVVTLTFIVAAFEMCVMHAVQYIWQDLKRTCVAYYVVITRFYMYPLFCIGALVLMRICMPGVWLFYAVVNMKRMLFAYVQLLAEFIANVLSRWPTPTAAEYTQWP